MTPPGGIPIDRAVQTASRAARQAGAVAVARLGRPGYLRWKGLRDVVSGAALEVQEAAASVLLDDFPESRVLAKEGPEEAALPVDAPHLWIVDPVCGSMNFVQGIPHFAVSVALRSEGGIRLGVVYDPCAGELFQAACGGPATLNGREIAVQQISDGTEAWGAAVVGTDWPPAGERRRRARSIAALMVDQAGECRVLGSPALAICYVAAGRLHAYWHLDLRIWDVAAAGLILERAGGILTDTQGMTWLCSEGDYLASNGVVHNNAMHCIQSVPPPPGAAAPVPP